MILEIENIENPVIIKDKVYVLVEQTKVEALLSDNQRLKAEILEHKADLKEVKKVIQGILRVLGLLDENTGNLKESIASGEENYIKPIVKSLGRLVITLTTNKEAVVKDFAFIEQIFPIMKKHQNI
jgi:hypothetical protein